MSGPLVLIDTNAITAADASGLKHLASTASKDKPMKMLLRDPETGATRVVTLAEIIAGAAENPA